jgi:hypothetical protein
MSGALRLLPYAVAVLCLGSTGVAFPNPVAEPQPQRIWTEAELRAELFEGSSHARAEAVSVLKYLWDGGLDIAMDALRSDQDALKSAAVRFLAGVGDADALDTIRGVLADTTLSLRVRGEAAKALSYVGDESAIPLIEGMIAELGATIGADGRTADGSIRSRFQQYSLQRSLDRLLRPGLRRPLVVKGHDFISYRFLLDDIQSISFITDSFFEFPPELARPDQRREYHLPDGDHRLICDLLQDGRFARYGSVWEGEYLVIELVDSSEVVFVKNGDLFCSSGRDWAGLDHFCVRASALARYLAEAVPDAASYEESSRAGGESSN